MNYQVLMTEIDADPLGRGYSGMTNQEIASDMNTLYREKNRERMSPTEVLNTVVIADWVALTADEQRQIWDILHMGGDLDPFGNEATIFTSVFGGGSDTIVALADARKDDISRGTELGLGNVRESDIVKAQAI